MMIIGQVNHVEKTGSVGQDLLVPRSLDTGHSCGSGARLMHQTRRIHSERPESKGSDHRSLARGAQASFTMSLNCDLYCDFCACSNDRAYTSQIRRNSCCLAPSATSQEAIFSRTRPSCCGRLTFLRIKSDDGVLRVSSQSLHLLVLAPTWPTLSTLMHTQPIPRLSPVTRNNNWPCPVP